MINTITVGRIKTNAIKYSNLKNKIFHHFLWSKKRLIPFEEFLVILEITK